MFRISRVAPAAVAFAAGTAAFASASETLWYKRESKPTPLSQSSWNSFTLVNVEQVNHDTSIFSFSLPSPTDALNMPVASCVSVSTPTKEGDKRLARPYTPVSPPQQQGTFDLMIKKYNTGNLSEKIHSMQVGDAIEAMGPWDKVPIIPNNPDAKYIGMIAGGTGITPMLQVIDAVLSNPLDRTHISLVFANKTPADILLKQKLDRLAEDPRLNVSYTVDRASLASLWGNGHVGRVSPELVRECLPKPSRETLILVCGPDPMVEAVSGKKGPKMTQGHVGGILAKAGYTDGMVYKF